MKKLLLAVVLVCALLVLAGCGNDTNTTEPQTDPENIKELSLVVDALSIADLDKYPNLEKLDLTGSTCYAQILDYAQANPKVEVLYSVSVGSAQIANTETEITLYDGTYEYGYLLENLQYIPKLGAVHLKNTRITAQQMDALRQKYPDRDFSCTIRLNGVELGEDTTELNLGAMTSAQVDLYLSKLPLLPNLKTVELMGADGKTGLTTEDVEKLRQAMPSVTFNHHYEFELFGQTISTAAERVEFVNVQIGDQGEKQIRSALDKLGRCTYFLLDNCGLSNDVLAGIRDDYPHIKIVWRIYQTNANRSWLTDTEVLRAVYHVNDTNSVQFKYLTEVKYMDLGHNTSLTNIGFCAYMPNLEIAILSGSPIKNLTPLGNCKKLEFLELAWCGHITDVSPLAGCESLKYLNIGHTSIKNVETLKDLPLEMLSFVNSGNKVKMTEADWQAIQALMPDCWITYAPLKNNDAFPYGVGWRYTKDPMAASNFTECYKKVRQVFEYDKIDQAIAGGSSNPTGNTVITTISKVVTAQTITELELYPDLKEADLTGSTCYETILVYMSIYPDVKVTFTVPLGGTTVVKNTTQELTLAYGSYEYDVLFANLKYVTGLKSLTLPFSCLTTGKVEELRAAYPEIDIQYAGGGSDPTGHNYLSKVTAPTCTEGGYTTHTCANCGDTYVTDEVAALGHTWIAATCEKPKTCATCGTTQGTALGHSYGAVVTAPTCTKGGYTSHTCSNCADTYVTDEVAALGHTWVDANCENPKTCSVCGTAEGEAKGHAYDTVATDPTCTEDGGATYTCTVCGHSYTEEIEALGHDYTSEGIAPTCTEGGCLTYTCGNCGHSYTEELAATGHSYSSEGTAPTCTAKGHTTYTCTVCGHSYTEEIPATGHSYINGVCVNCIEIDLEATTVDLSAMIPEQVEAAIAKLNTSENVVWVNLMKTDGTSNLSIADVKKLQQGCPELIFQYSFTLFGKTVSTTDSRIEYKNKSIGDSGEGKIREALDILKGCSYFLLDTCGLSNEVLGKIRDDYPKTKVVWRIVQPNKTWRTWLTDTEMLRAVYGITDENSGQFKYLTEVKYMDLGHNEGMVDISFCAYMPNLEIAILSGSPIKDLTPLSNCKKLEFLELAWCGYVKDVSPLAGCESLKYLNIGHTRAKNIEALKDLPLEMLSFVNSGNRLGMTEADWQAIQALMPDCWITYAPLKDNNAFPYGVGWRYTQTPMGPSTYTAIYRRVRDIFGYDNM